MRIWVLQFQRTLLLTVEIADSSKRYDMGRKAKLYATFGCASYG
jgi:hypothetical protein